MAFAYRIGDFSPFARTLSLDEDDRNGALEVGFVTYHNVDDIKEETYKVTSMTVGARADHLTDLATELTGKDVIHLTVDAPLATDKELLREPKADADKSGNKQASPEAA